MLLAQRQQIAAQEWPRNPGERAITIWVEEPPQGINANTGLMLVLHNWGGVYDSPEYIQWSRTFAERFNVITTSVNYLQSGPGWCDILPYDYGYLQALDCLRALHALWQQLHEAGVAFNEHRVYSMGGSGGGNVTQMVMKLAPHTFACGVDICGMPGLVDVIAYADRESGANPAAGYSRDPHSPLYLSRDMIEIRDFGHPEHCRLLHEANPNLKIVIVHGVDDASCPVLPKILQYHNMLAAGLDVDAHFITDFDVDGIVLKTTGHALGDREQIIIKYADVYMKEDGKFARATAGPSDFTRGGTVEYSTSGGSYVVDFSGPPTIAFVPA